MTEPTLDSPPSPTSAAAPEPTASPLRVAVSNVGCKLNQHEAEALMAGFSGRGYCLVGTSEAADIVVVNTCTVTGSGDADSRRTVRRARRRNPAATVVATGCYAQRCPEDLAAAGADLVVGNGEKVRLIDHLEAHLRGEVPPALPGPGTPPGTGDFLAIEGAVPGGRTRGTLKIQDGCDEHCTYCIIPSVRGPGISRPADEVVEQARRMADAGYREVALTGVHSGSYGRDRGESEALVRLLEALGAVPGLERLRLNSVEPAFLTDALIDFAASSGRLCRHFHIPLQSGDDGILRRMGRRYTRARYRDRVLRVAEAIPGCALGADVMVGFPGEGEEQFAQTRDLVEELPLTYLHVFTYSPRQGTPATRLAAPPAAATCSNRSRHLIGLGRAKRLAFHQRHLGQQVAVLVEDRRDRTTGLSVGLTDNYIKVLIDGQPTPNEFAHVAVERVREDLAYGSMIP